MLTLFLHIQDQMEKEGSDIRAVFTAVFGLVRAAYNKASQPLKERKQDVEREAKGLTDGLHAEISRLEQTISMLENFSEHEDHIYFLQVEALQDRKTFSKYNEI